MSRKVFLTKMTSSEYAEYAIYRNEHHASNLQKEKDIDKDAALQETAEMFDKALPDGEETTDNYLMIIRRREDSSAVGYMWYMYDHRRADTYLFLCDFHIFKSERRKGYAEDALYEMEDAGRALSCKKCAFFVANENSGARKLYEKCGYVYRNERDGGRYMDKDI